MGPLAEWPKRLDHIDWMPAKHAFSSRFFKEPPDLVVIHSGATGVGVAEYLVTVADDREVSAHFSWSAVRDRFVQQVELDREAWHAGKHSVFHGARSVNARSIGIELPGPAAATVRDPDQREQLRGLLVDLRDALPSLVSLTGHQWISLKRWDPGPGVTAGWFDGLGYDVYWTKRARLSP
jgi:N-acetyl-anhydromuramyl-L-alanine amidase AmpD